MSLFVEYCINLTFHDLFLSSKELMIRHIICPMLVAFIHNFYNLVRYFMGLVITRLVDPILMTHASDLSSLKVNSQW